MMRQRTIAVSGASGFVGQQVCSALVEADMQVRPLVRSGAGGERIVIGDLSVNDFPRTILEGVDVLIHTAARAHRIGESKKSALEAYRAANVIGTRRILRAALSAGVRRFVHLSSIKACGERSRFGNPLTPDDPCHPEDPYGVSKAEAEEVVRSAEGSIETVILRPVLIYGTGVRGNLHRLLTAVAKGKVLPVGAARNRRSMLAIENLVDLIRFAIDAPMAGFTFHPADTGTVGTRELVELLAEELGVKTRICTVPPTLVTTLAALFDRREQVRRVFDDLEVADPRLSAIWKSPLTLEGGLRAMAREWRNGGGWPG